LLSEYPANGIENIGFSAAVWPYDRGDPGFKIKGCFMVKGFKSDDLEFLKVHGKFSGKASKVTNGK